MEIRTKRPQIRVRSEDITRHHDVCEAVGFSDLSAFIAVATNDEDCLILVTGIPVSYGELREGCMRLNYLLGLYLVLVRKGEFGVYICHALRFCLAAAVCE